MGVMVHDGGGGAVTPSCADVARVTARVVDVPATVVAVVGALLSWWVASRASAAVRRQRSVLGVYCVEGVVGALAFPDVGVALTAAVCNAPVRTGDSGWGQKRNQPR